MRERHKKTSHARDSSQDSGLGPVFEEKILTLAKIVNHESEFLARITSHWISYDKKHSRLS